MGIIHVLDAQTANMIAAGEVVERPASALKELLENALDAGARRISVDVKGGGRAFLRVTDNGQGFYRDDMPKALLRHATSKIRDGSDLDAIATFGFRGEALAAIGSVSRMEILSRRRDETVGTRLTCDERGVVMTDTGCPEGTSVIVRDLFYNTPARQKFLKRDSAEASACVTVASHAALSHPEVSFTVSVDGEKRFFTAGDGKLQQAVYAVFGKGFAAGLLPIDGEQDGVHVHGFVTSPDNARGNRSMQTFFVNNRPVRSKTVMAALEEAFRSYLPHGKYPGAVLFVDLAYGLTDVNVHPAKLEIRFVNERPIFSAVYYAVKSRLQQQPAASASAETEEQKPSAAVSPTREMPAKQPFPTGTPRSEPPFAEQDRQKTTYADTRSEQPTAAAFRPSLGEEDLDPGTLLTFRQPTEEEAKRFKQPSVVQPSNADEPPQGGREVPEPIFPDKSDGSTEAQTQMDERPYWKWIGEAFDAFLFVETKDSVLVIDKHAAHERILYEQLASRKEVHTQQLLQGIPVELSEADAAALCENAAYLEEYGFVLEPFGETTVLIRAVPSTLAHTDQLASLLEAFASELAVGSRLSFAEKCDRALFTVACKAALKAGIPNDRAHNEWIVGQLFEHPSVRFCPHGRPVLHRLSKREIEKYFDR